MESLSPYKKEIALGILKQIEQAILRLQGCCLPIRKYLGKM